MEITDKRHGQALDVERAVTAESQGKTHPPSYWLALACCMLTSPVKAEREAGKALVKRWKYKTPPA